MCCTRARLRGTGEGEPLRLALALPMWFVVELKDVRATRVQCKVVLLGILILVSLSTEAP